MHLRACLGNKQLRECRDARPPHRDRQPGRRPHHLQRASVARIERTRNPGLPRHTAKSSRVSLALNPGDAADALGHDTDTAAPDGMPCWRPRRIRRRSAWARQMAIRASSCWRGCGKGREAEAARISLSARSGLRLLDTSRQRGKRQWIEQSSTRFFSTPQ